MRQLVVRLILATAAVAAGAVVAAAVLLDMAGDRAAARAQVEADLAALVTVAEVTTDEEALLRAIGRTATGRAGGLALHLDGRTIGRSHAAVAGSAGEIVVDGGTVLVRPVTGGVAPAVAEAFVPDWRPDASHLVLAGLLAAAGLLGAGAGLAVSRRRLRPVTADLATLTATARVVGEGGPLPVPRTMRTPETAALAAALGTVADRIEDARSRERRMVADLSHRLRTPLTALALDAEAIGDGPAARRVRSAVESLDKDVDALIRAVPQESAGPIRCDVVEVVQRRMAFWSALGQHSGRGCTVRTPDAPAVIALAGDDLAAVVDALLGNIFRYTPDGTRFAVSVVRHAGWISLVVDDAGPGVPDPVAALRRGVSGSGSTGLGLDIARDAVEATGGTIHIERSALGGARIRLRFAEVGVEHADPHEPRAWRLWRSRDRAEPRA
ncbi:sensor histidine kinase [Pseudonocardia nigra]|uniref:sensor histidine kinase n=1 Tax=Pseudonocardia nigra TaxID=1921578 RepID=UPI001C5E602F|nr:HAMP domain-containing sensor histidine kinase [Pseudonocardia nigra]